MVLQIIGTVSEPKQAKNIVSFINIATLVLTTAINTYNNTLISSLFSNYMLLLVAMGLAAGGALSYRCRFRNAFMISFIFLSSMALIDFFLQTCLYFFLKPFNTIRRIFLCANTYRGIYLLLLAGFAYFTGTQIKKWLMKHSFEANLFRPGNILIVAALSGCMIYFQRIYVLAVPEHFISHWWIFILGLLVLVLFGWGYRIKQKDEELLRIQELRTSLLEENYQNLMHLYEEKSVLIHDMRNHLRIIGELLETSSHEDVRHYIEELTGNLIKLKGTVLTGHSFLNLILNMKKQEAEEKGITFSCRCDNMEELNLKPGELCALFCNLLDNAIEANEKRQAGDGRRIELQCRREGELLILVISNTTDKGLPPLPADFFPETTKRDKKLHGIGMRSIKKVADSHDGYVNLKLMDDVFSATVCLNGFDSV